MRWYLMVILFTLTAVSANQKSIPKSHDKFLGRRIRGDTLIKQKVVEESGVPFWVSEKRVTIAGDGVMKITFVEIFDLNAGLHSATPFIMKGGPGKPFVTINFKSQRGYGIHFLIKVYGKK